MKNKDKIKYFVDNYLMSNGKFFDFISDYGETDFFLDLWEYVNEILDGDNPRIFYGEITHTYYIIKNYFDTH